MPNGTSAIFGCLVKMLGWTVEFVIFKWTGKFLKEPENVRLLLHWNLFHILDICNPSDKITWSEKSQTYLSDSSKLFHILKPTNLLQQTYIQKVTQMLCTNSGQHFFIHIWNWSQYNLIFGTLRTCLAQSFTNTHTQEFTFLTSRLLYLKPKNLLTDNCPKHGYVHHHSKEVLWHQRSIHWIVSRVHTFPTRMPEYFKKP